MCFYYCEYTDGIINNHVGAKENVRNLTNAAKGRAGIVIVGIMVLTGPNRRSAPAPTSASTIAVWPFFDARVNAVSPCDCKKMQGVRQIDYIYR